MQETGRPHKTTHLSSASLHFTAEWMLLRARCDCAFGKSWVMSMLNQQQPLQMPVGLPIAGLAVVALLAVGSCRNDGNVGLQPAVPLLRVARHEPIAVLLPAKLRSRGPAPVDTSKQ